MGTRSKAPYDHDVEKAKVLLKEAGVTNLTLDLLYSDNKPWWETERSRSRPIWPKRASGESEKVAYATMREMIDRENSTLHGVWSPDFADPFMFMNNWFDSRNFGLAGNRAFYKNEEMDRLVRKAASINSKEERIRLYRRAQRIAIEEAPYIYLYQKDFLLPIRKEVKGFVYNPMLEGIYNIAEMSK